MGSKRRGILMICAGAAVALAKGSNEAARLLARGSDEVIAGTAKSSDEAQSSSSKIDELVTAGKRYYRRKRMEALLSDETQTASFTLPPGSYAGYRIEPGIYTDLEFQFQTQFNTEIDAFVLGKSSFEQYEREGQFDGLGTATAYQTASETVTVNLESDKEYVLLFDHTAAGLAGPVDYDVLVETEATIGLTQ